MSDRPPSNIWTIPSQTTDRKYQQGSASEFDLITARVRLANSRPPLIKAANRVDILKTILAKEMGREDQDYEIEGSLDFTPFNGELDAIVGACEVRLRPGLMTNLSTVVA